MSIDEGDSERLGQASALAAPNKPHTIYFYYILFTSNTDYTIKSYHYFSGDNPIDNPSQKIIDLTANAIDGGSNPLPNGTSFDEVNRARKGWFVIALDGAEFIKPDPIDFECNDAQKLESINNNGRHTFYYRGRLDDTIRGRQISIVNYLYPAKSFDHGEDLLDDEWEHFVVRFLYRRGAQLTEFSYEDSGGTNMGPPPPPPGRIYVTDSVLS
jgi:hypothetical protein